MKYWWQKPQTSWPLRLFSPTLFPLNLVAWERSGQRTCTQTNNNIYSFYYYCKSLVNEIPTSFIFQVFSTWNTFFDVTKQLFHNFVFLIQFEISKLKLLPLDTCHKHPCFQQGAPYPLQISNTCENGSVAKRRDNW